MVCEQGSALNWRRTFLVTPLRRYDELQLEAIEEGMISGLQAARKSECGDGIRYVASFVAFSCRGGGKKDESDVLRTYNGL